MPYGHFGDRCVHVRIDFELATDQGRAGYRGFIEDAADLVASYGGSMSGEHGDRRARSRAPAKDVLPGGDRVDGASKAHPRPRQHPQPRRVGRSCSR
ncbi:MAG: FAD-linked oxidase C-terminal domain-containing protein [Marmoricola sp.]